MEQRVQDLQLDLTLLLPEMDAGDRCVDLLTDWLASVRGVEQAHIVRSNGRAQLCLHYDPNLVSLGQLKRLALEAGASVTDRYRHEQLPFAGLDAADAALALAQELERLPGMLHASVSCAAGLIDVAYEGEVLDRRRIEQAVRALGARIVGPARRRGIRPSRLEPAPLAAEEPATALRRPWRRRRSGLPWVGWARRWHSRRRTWP